MLSFKYDSILLFGKTVSIKHSRVYTKFDSRFDCLDESDTSTALIVSYKRDEFDAKVYGQVRKIKNYITAVRVIIIIIIYNART